MNAKEVHYELIMATEKVIKSYRDDLFVHDYSALEADANRNWKVSPFIHIAYESGTILDMFYSIHDFPYGDKRIPFLFGTADKFELLENVGNSLRSGQAKSDNAIIHYFDGEVLRKISLDEGELLVTKYKRDMRRLLEERE